MKKYKLLLILLFFILPAIVSAQKPSLLYPQEDVDTTTSNSAKTRHQGIFNGKVINYIATAERIPVTVSNKIEVQIFYTSYIEESANFGSRPLTFVFNGGPGAATAWLHIGGIGPRRILLNSDGSTLPPPVKLVDNNLSPLSVTDLVFVDAPGTGFSRVYNAEAKKKLYNYNGDLNACSSFIIDYLIRNNRWSSPIYLFGESYGGTRVSGLSDYLVRRGVEMKGVILLAPALNISGHEPTIYNDLPYILSIPTMTAIAAFHHKLDTSLQKLDLNAQVALAKNWAFGEYRDALTTGNLLSKEDRKKIVRKLSTLTGIAENVIEANNLRINVQTFMKYLLPESQMLAGRVDGRLTGADVSNIVEEPFYDPAMGSLTPAFATAFQNYMLNEIKYSSAVPYRMYSKDVAQNWDFSENVQPLAALQSTLVKNKDFKVLAMNGIYDLAVTFTDLEYYLDQMPIPFELTKNITKVRLPGGHMVYTDAKAMPLFSRAIVDFYNSK